MYKNNNVFVRDTKVTSYPEKAPYNPDEIYPEYKFDKNHVDKNNFVYKEFRQLLYDMGLDKSNYDKPNWNPFKEFIKEGDIVLIKPNMVLHYNKNPKSSMDSIITNGSLIRAVVDYAYIALKGTGRIVIGDAPIQRCVFEDIIETNGVLSIQQLYKNKGYQIEIIDFRKESVIKKKRGKISNVKDLNGDPLGYTAIDLGKNSLLNEISSEYKKFRVTNYIVKYMRGHHNKTTHEYLIPNTVLISDVIINLPKPKTHRKAGMTGAMKNLVGINGNKDWLPHHRAGSIFDKGDEYQYRNFFKKINTKINETKDFCNIRKLNFLNSFFYALLKINKIFINLTKKDNYFEGSWWGNDTIWRTVCDINRILLYIDKNGMFQKNKQKKYLAFLDMIISGEKEGPLSPTPKETGILVGGYDSLLVDTVISTIMGLDYKKIPNIKKAYTIDKYPITNNRIDDIIIKSNNPEWYKKLNEIKYEHTLKFHPSRGWEGHIEMSPPN